MIRAATQHKVSTLILAAGLALLGALSIRDIPVDFLPDIKYPLIKLSIEWPGATAEDVERNLADEIEREMASVDGLDFLSSSSLEGLYQLDVNFRYGVDVDVAYQDALAAFARAQKNLPTDIEPAVIIKADPSQLPVVQVVFESDRMDLRDLRLWIDNWLVERLMAARGVAAVDVAGGLKREIRVYLDSETLEKHGLSLAQIEQRLREENVQRLGGRITGSNRETILRTLGEFTDLDQIRSIVVQRTGIGTLRLGDIANVEDTHEEIRLITRLDGRPAIKVNVIKQADANTVLTVREVEQRLRELEPSFPVGMGYVLVENQADYIVSALRGVSRTAVEAAILVMLGFFLFLGSPRLVLIIVLALPVTVLANFFIMRQAGFSLNILSLGGLIVAISVLLDPSTIVLENIARKRVAHPGLPVSDVAVSGTKEVGGAVAAAGMAFIALFLPFLIVRGMVPLLFRELVLVILSIVILSSLGALTLTPCLASILMRHTSNVAARPSFAERLDQLLQRLYSPIVALGLRHRLVTLGVFVVLMIVGVMAFVRSGAEFFPAVDDGRLMVKVKMPAGVPLEQLDAANRRIEALVAGDPRVASVFAMSGGAVRGLYTNKIGNEGEVDIELVPSGQRAITTSAYLEELRSKVATLSIPSMQFMPMQRKMRGIRTLGTSDIEIEVNGADVAELFRIATALSESLRESPLLANVHLSLDYSKPEYQAIIDREKAADLGLTVEGIARDLRGYVGGNVPTQFREANELYDLRVLVPDRSLNNRTDVENLAIALPDGGFVRLRDIASVESRSGPVEILRHNQTKQVIVRADSPGANLQAARDAAVKAVAGFSWPAGYSFSISGKAKQMAEMQQSVKAILGLALFLSFIVLAVQFNSLRLPMVVLLGVPFCLAGAGFGLYVTGQPFGATVVIALLVILAANVNDAVLLIESAERRRTLGSDPRDAAHQAANLRLRPRLMTTLPIVLGFLPLALALEPGGELLRPMAAAAIGGLLAEVLVALFLVPVLYSMLTSRRIKEIVQHQKT